MTGPSRGRPLRADAERTMHAILEVADRLLRHDPATTLEEIATAAGVARTTLHRRFATREDLIEAMRTSALKQVDEAIDAGRPDTAPPPVALHQVTANVIRVKSNWRFATKPSRTASEPVVQLQDRITVRCLRLLGRFQRAGLLPAATDLSWPQRTYYALLDMAIDEHADDGTDPDELAERVVTTLLHGVGDGGSPPSRTSSTAASNERSG